MRAAALASLLLFCAPAAGSEASGIGALLHEISEGILGNAAEALGTADSDHFYSARLRAGLLLRHESAYDFVALGLGATRYEQQEWATSRYSVVGALRKVERGTGAGIVASVGISEVADHLRAIIDATWNVRLSRATGFELIGQRDFVETRAGLDAGTMSNFAALSVDHAVTDRLTLVGLGGLQYFSDENRRTHLRGRAIYALMPEQGLSVQARVRGYESSRPEPSTYFNPEHYAQADLGLRLRRSLGRHWRVQAAAGAGQEDIDPGDRSRTYYLEARAERYFGNDLWLALTYALDHSSASDAASADYTWHYFRAVLVIPF